MNWRPDDWDKIRIEQSRNCNLVDFESGASALLSAVIKWLWEPCNCLDHAQIVEFTIDVKGMYPHRKDCPQCMAELRGEK